MFTRSGREVKKIEDEVALDSEMMATLELSNSEICNKNILGTPNYVPIWTFPRFPDDLEVELDVRSIDATG